jgi:large subunit ribosomal protein L10
VNRTEKQTCIDELNAEFRNIKNAILIDYRGLKVVDVTQLRREIHKLSSKYVVVKNTLAILAAKDTSLESLKDCLKGPTAIAYNDSDAVPLTKFLLDFAKTKPQVQFKAGLVEGKPISVDQLESIAKLPGRPELLAKLIYLLKAPMTHLVSVLKSPVRDLAAVVKQVPK